MNKLHQIMPSMAERMVVALAALCPVLLVCRDLVTALVMGIAFLSLLLLSSLSISLCRRLIMPEYTVAMLLLVCASWICCIDLLMQAYIFEIRQALGVYLPLLAMNGFIVLTLQQTALVNDPISTLKLILGPAIVFFATILLLGATRELLGAGTLFANAELLPFPGFPTLEFEMKGMSILNSPAAIFLLLGLACSLLKSLSLDDALSS